MSITFECEHCRKEVKAPDSAAGRRGKCPCCGQSNYIPAPVSEEDLPPLAPLDEEEERRQAREVEKLRRQESELISETGGGAEAAPPEQQGDLKPEDVYHHVVNYWLDMGNMATGVWQVMLNGGLSSPNISQPRLIILNRLPTLNTATK